MRRHTISIKHALDGVIYVLKTQPNFQVHLVLALLALAAGFFFRLSRAEWAVVIFVIGLVLIAEMINTSLESMVDLLTEEHRLSAKIAKDVAAGMVLVAAVIAALTGLIIFLPYLNAAFT